MYALVLLTALAPAADADTSATPPDQVMARIDAKGNLTITSINPPCNYGPGYGYAPVAPAAEKPAVKVKVTTLVITTEELPAKHVKGFTADGEAVSADKLAVLLLKERPVLLARDGKKVDPFLLQLYKSDTIVLVPPPNTLTGGQSGGVHSAPVVVPGVAPAPLPPGGIEKVPVPDRPLKIEKP